MHKVPCVPRWPELKGGLTLYMVPKKVVGFRIILLYVYICYNIMSNRHRGSLQRQEL